LIVFLLIFFLLIVLWLIVHPEASFLSHSPWFVSARKLCGWKRPGLGGD